MAAAACAGCGLGIRERWLLQVLDKAWHPACVACADCRAPLADRCFERGGRLFCRADFLRRFATKCAGCGEVVGKADLIRRARDKVFHVGCFCCGVCGKRLDTGEELYILNGAKFICKNDYLAARCVGSEFGSDEELEAEGAAESDGEKSDSDLGLTDLAAVSTHPDTPTPTKSEALSGASPTKSPGGEEGVGGGGTKRRGPRTTIKAKQLETLKAAFAATPKPTRHVREQLAQETGLNMRVIQVWFQNRRSKERRMKQLRYGPYRPGRRSRASRDEQLLNPHLFGPDGLGRDYYHMGGPGGPPEPYFMMMGGEPPHPGMELGLPPGHPGAPFPPISLEDGGIAPLEAHPPEAQFLMGSRRSPSADGEVGYAAFGKVDAAMLTAPSSGW